VVASSRHRDRGKIEEDEMTEESDSEIAQFSPRRTLPVAHPAVLPQFLKVPDVAELLRTTPGAIYSMVERGLLPGITRIGRRVLVRSDDLLHWLRQKSASSLKE
jgi:excisionase family DNA binding protein